MNINSVPVFRVIFESREHYRVIDENKNIFAAEISGSLRKSGEIWPAVGDWVYARPQPGDWVLIDSVQERKSVLQRQDSESGRPQVIAANVDVLFIVTSANEDFNLNRLERYLALAFSGGVKPVIVINKIELAEDPMGLINAAAERFSNVDVHGVSVYESLNVEALEAYATEGVTLAFIGSSGVGKSSLTNFLLGEELMFTSEIREEDGRGRHTTTYRELHIAKNGSVIIDNPGLRSVGLVDNVGLESVFADIENLMSQCRFSDCQHEDEPGCTVQSALNNGEISDERWQSYEKLQREVAFEQRKQSKALMSDQKKEWAKRSQQLRHRLKEKGRK